MIDFWSLYACAHVKIYTYEYTETQRRGETEGVEGGRGRGKERVRGRESFPISAAALLDILILTYISQSAFQGALSASDESNHISVKLVK